METLKEKIAKFLAIDTGYGNGCGYGNGSGNGSGNGNGYGYGDGNGSGYGDGDGYGNGCGYGNGSGNGSGNGYGYGYGNGCGYSSGSGDSSGIKMFDGHNVYYVDGMPTLIYSVKGNLAKGAIVNRDFTIKDCYVAKSGNYFAHGETAHKAYTSAEQKALENEPIGNRIKRFVAKYPNFDAKIPAQELFEWHYALTGSCEFGRRQFAKQHGINLETDSFTVNEFVELTKNQYGGENIKLLNKQS